MAGSVLFGDWLQYVFGPALFITSVFLILLILVQRGRGGGLAGSLGGMGGQSAFGSKAGDLFTMITVVISSVWVLLCCFAIACLNPQVRTAPKDKQESVTSSEESTKGTTTDTVDKKTKTKVADDTSVIDTTKKEQEATKEKTKTEAKNGTTKSESGTTKASDPDSANTPPEKSEPKKSADPGNVKEKPSSQENKKPAPKGNP